MKTDDEDKAPEAVKAEEASKLPPSTETSPKTTKVGFKSCDFFYTPGVENSVTFVKHFHIIHVTIPFIH